MSQENVEILRPIYAEWEQGNLKAGTELLAPEIESTWPSEFPSGGTYHGPEGHRRAMREWLSAWAPLQLQAEGFIDAGERVVVPFRVRGHGKGSGIDVDRRFAHVWTMRGGRAVRFEVYLDPDEALESVGLSEQDAQADS
jgi:uncharacterized protein